MYFGAQTMRQVRSWFRLQARLAELRRGDDIEHEFGNLGLIAMCFRLNVVAVKSSLFPSEIC